MTRDPYTVWTWNRMLNLSTTLERVAAHIIPVVQSSAATHWTSVLSVLQYSLRVSELGPSVSLTASIVPHMAWSTLYSYLTKYIISYQKSSSLKSQTCSSHRAIVSRLLISTTNQQQTGILMGSTQSKQHQHRSILLALTQTKAPLP